MLPTFLKLAGRDVGAAPLDGIDISAALLEQGPLPPRDLFWRYHGKAAVRRGRWKLVRTATGCELFDLADDPGERRDLAPAHPDLVADLLRAFENWEQEVLAGVTLST